MTVHDLILIWGILASLFVLCAIAWWWIDTRSHRAFRRQVKSILWWTDKSFHYQMNRDIRQYYNDGWSVEDCVEFLNRKYDDRATTKIE